MLKMNARKILVLTGLAVTLAGVTGSSFAQETQWQKNHPRRTEVNQRTKVQNARINAKVAEGKMTPGQAQALHKEDHQIHQEERAMASQNGGHITKSEQRTLNQQENAVSKQIRSE